VDAEVQGALQIAQDAFHCGEVRLTGIMHMKANLLDGVDDVGAGERQVLEDPDEAPELSRISNKRPKNNRDLSLRVHSVEISLQSTMLACSRTPSVNWR
jgi:hypothetical protein